MPTKRSKIFALLRNSEKARLIFGELLEAHDFVKLVGDVTATVEIDENIDIIFHCAAVIALKQMIREPVETLMTAVKGTENILELDHIRKAKSFVYLSSFIRQCGITEDYRKGINELMRSFLSRGNMWFKKKVKV